MVIITTPERLKQGNDTRKKDKNLSNSSPIKAFLGEVAYNAATAVPAAENFIVSLPRLVKNTYKAATDKNYGILDNISDSFGADSWGNNFIDNVIDPIAKNTFDREDWENLSDEEKVARAGGSLVPLFGINYVNKANKLTKVNKLAKNSKLNNFKNAKEIVTGNTGKLVNKEIVGNPTSRSPSQGIRGIISPIKTTNSKKLNAAAYMLPGIQVDKGIPLSQQKLAIGLQSGFIGGTYGIQEYLTNKQEELQQKQLETLIKDKRKSVNDPNNIIQYDPYALENYELNSEDDDSIIIPALLIGGSIFGGRKFIKRYGNLLTKETAKSVTDTDPEAIRGLSSKLDTKTKADISIADRFGFRRNLVNEGLISEEVANDLAVDLKTKVNYQFDNLYNGLYRKTLNRMEALRAKDPEQFNLLNRKYNIYSKMQDDAYRYGKYIAQNNDFNTENYIRKVKEGLEVPNSSYLTKEDIATLEEEIKSINSKLSEDAKKLNRDISNAFRKDYENMHNNHQISDRMYLDSLLNRKTFGDDIALYHYKPIVKDLSEPYYAKFSKLMLDTEPYDPRIMPNKEMRGPHGIDVDNSKPIDQVFEKAIKENLYNIELNKQKYRFVDELIENQTKKIEEIIQNADEKITELDNRISKINNDKFRNELIRQKKELVKDYAKQVKGLFHIKHIGSVDLHSSPNTIIPASPMFNLGNPNKNELHKLLNDYNNTASGLMDKYQGKLDTAKDLIALPFDGRIDYYKVDQAIADAFNFNPTLPNKIFELLKASKSLVQSTITGRFNPGFAPAAFTMSLHEALTVFPKIASELELLQPASRFAYLHEVGRAMREQFIYGQARDISDKITKNLVANVDLTPNERFLMNNNLRNMERKISNLLKTKIEAFGGGSQKPLTRNNERFFTLNTKSKISDNIYRFLIKHDGIDGAIQKAKILDYMQMALREGPQLGLTQYFGKLSGAIKNGEIVDPKKMVKIIDVVSTYTANVGKQGTGKGILGGLSKITSDYVTYGNIFIQSLAPKVRASGILDGISNLYNLSMRVFDPNARMCDTLMLMKANASQLIHNKFIQGLIFTSFIPTVLAYVWNHGSKENINSYYQRSDYDKASKFMLMNFFGTGNHLYIPKDQEVAMIDSLLYTILDSVFGMSKYNELDPGFEHSKVVMQSVARSLGVDSIPALDLLANASGKDINLNPFDENFGINDLSRNKLNPDMTETVYKNGLFNQEATSLINSIFGVLGSSLLTASEEYNVGQGGDTSASDAMNSFVDRFTKTSKLFGNKAVSTYNETSKTVYNKRNLINKIATIPDKNRNQQIVYDFIKMYNRNRIKPIHDEITKYRDLANTIRVTSKTKSGKVLDYSKRKDMINEVNKKLQLKFAEEYHEFENLDKLLQAKFGNGLTLENFMEKLYG